MRTVPRHKHVFHHSTADKPGYVYASIANGSVTGDKAFLALFSFFDDKRKLIPGPYKKLSFSKVGAYRYVAGGSQNTPAECFIPFDPPAGTKHMEVVFASWKHDEPIAFKELPAFSSTASTPAPAVAKPSVSTTKKADDAAALQRLAAFRDAQKATQFATDTAHLIRAREEPDAWIDLTDKPIWIDFKAPDTAELDLCVKISSENANAKNEALMRIEYQDTKGKELAYTGVDLVKSASVGLYKYLPTTTKDDFALVRLFVPKGCAKIGIGFQKWKVAHPVRIQNQIRFSSLQRGVSVIMPAYKAEKFIDQSLGSLAQQTLARDLFEVIVVLNGPKDNTQQRIRSIKRKNPKLNIVLIERDEGNAGAARNAALSAASYQYVTNLDADDSVSPDYLEILLNDAFPDRVVFSSIADVSAEGDINFKNPINLQITQSKRGISVSWDKVSSAITMNACKLLPSYYARQVAYPTSLKSSEDVCYFSTLLINFPLELYVSRRAEEAIYFRHITANSISRQSSSYDFNVAQRLKVIEYLDLELREHPSSPLAEMVRSKIRAQMQFLGRYCEENPDQYTNVIRSVRGQYFSYTPLDVINAGAAQTLVVAYCFPPYMDTSAIVMAKRAAAMREPFDVMYCRMASLREKDGKLNDIVRETMGRATEINTPPSFTQWPAMEAFASEVLKKTAALEETRAAYKRIYTRAMFPASHFVGAAYKARHPKTEWIAEFSDPLLYDIKSQPRNAPLSRAWLEETGILQAVSTRKITLPDNDNLFLWCEFLPYVLADTLLFTNENQKSYMLDVFPMQDMRALIESKARISPQPTPPPEHYNRVAYDYYLDPRCAHMAFFGSIYETRGLAEIFEALAELTPEQRKRIRFHVFSQQFRPMMQHIKMLGLEGVVIVNGYIGYFEHLNLLTKMDVLVLNDAATKGIKKVNPYLPSKLSDYAGAGTDIWGIVEKGSSLDRSPLLTYRSMLGSKKDYTATLKKIMKAKKI